nr:MAG TPA: hypothetical protein [Caudoviricetes sp.]
MIKMERVELELQGTLEELVMEWLLIGKAMREDVLAKKLGGSAGVDDILRDMIDTVIDHGKDLTDGTLNSETILATALIARTVAKFARLQDEENKEAGQEDDQL